MLDRAKRVVELLQEKEIIGPPFLVDTVLANVKKKYIEPVTLKATIRVSEEFEQSEAQRSVLGSSLEPSKLVTYMKFRPGPGKLSRNIVFSKLPEEAAVAENSQLKAIRINLRNENLNGKTPKNIWQQIPGYAENMDY